MFMLYIYMRLSNAMPCAEKKTSPASLRHFALGFSKENVFIHFLENSLSFVMCTYRKLVRRSRSSRRRRVCVEKGFSITADFLICYTRYKQYSSGTILYFVIFLIILSLLRYVRFGFGYVHIYTTYTIEMAFGKCKKSGLN